MVRLNERQKKLTEQLLISITNKEFEITYKELGGRTRPIVHQKVVGQDVGKILQLCTELGLPLITAMVIRAKRSESSNSEVGEGFYAMLQNLGIESDGLSEREVYEREIKRINECQEWYRLADHLELDIPQLFNGKQIRILPMSSKQFPEKSYWEIQNSYFLDELIKEEGYYYFGKKGMNAPEGSFVLFRINNNIIAAATLEKIIKEYYDDESKGAFVFDVDSIEVFEPITEDELLRIDSNFPGFLRNKQELDYKNLDKIKYLIKQKKQPIIPEELPIYNNQKYPEGSKHQITVNAYERNSVARKECIRIHGYVCGICGFEFGDFYGEEFAKIIHVHHIKPLNEIDDRYEVDPEKDLIPVCPNCHAVIHSRKAEVYSIEEMKEIIARKKKN